MLLSKPPLGAGNQGVADKIYGQFQKKKPAPKAAKKTAPKKSTAKKAKKPASAKKPAAKAKKSAAPKKIAAEEDNALGQKWPTQRRQSQADSD